MQVLMGFTYNAAWRCLRILIKLKNHHHYHLEGYPVLTLMFKHNLVCRLSQLASVLFKLNFYAVTEAVSIESRHYIGKTERWLQHFLIHLTKWTFTMITSGRHFWQILIINAKEMKQLEIRQDNFLLTNLIQPCKTQWNRSDRRITLV